MILEKSMVSEINPIYNFFEKHKLWGKFDLDKIEEIITDDYDYIVDDLLYIRDNCIFDENGLLISESFEGHEIKYYYDENKNLIKKTINDNEYDVNYIYDENNRLIEETGNKTTKEYYYDDKGNKTMEMIVIDGHSEPYDQSFFYYDDNNQLIKSVIGIGFEIKNKYDYRGNIIETNVIDIVTKYVYSDDNELLIEISNNGNERLYYHKNNGKFTIETETKILFKMPLEVEK